MEQQRVRLGELLVGAKIITPEQLQEVLALQAGDGRRLGALLVASGYVSETQVTQILSQQLSVPWVSLHHIDFSRQLLNLVARELAERHCLIPIYVRRSRHQRETLYIAMDDPSDAEARAEVELYAGLPVKPMIAPPSDIRAAIRVYYGGESPQAPPPRPAPERSVMPVPPPQRPVPPPAHVVGSSTGGPSTGGPSTSAESSAPPAPVAAELAALESTGAAAEVSSPAANEAPTPPLVLEAPAPPAMESGPSEESGPASRPVMAREASMPGPARPHASPKMVTLTLLDGTQLNLPAAPGRPRQAEAAADLLTARDLVAALRAHASGADVSQVLGNDINWQRLCAALLAVLLRKQLIADWEFVEELRR
jgi:type IV pilus assembly protein PilB